MSDQVPIISQPHRRLRQFALYLLATLMSVYTAVEPAELEQFLTRYQLGAQRCLLPIAAGVTNTNYYLDTEAGQFVLTLYEHHSHDELDYMLGLQQHLVTRSVQCSEPVIDRQGNLYSSLKQRPAAIIKRLPGQPQQTLEPWHCALIGAELARFHLAGQDYRGFRSNPRGNAWIESASTKLADHLSPEDQQSIENSLRCAADFSSAALPTGSIHADLFHDNALFLESRLGGIVDFDYACRDSFVFDIAVLLNDWCIDEQMDLVADRVNAVLQAYQQQRILLDCEISALPMMLRIAALRFWLSRLYDEVFPLPGELTFIKCPDKFRQMHQMRSDQIDQITKSLATATVRYSL